MEQKKFKGYFQAASCFFIVFVATGLAYQPLSLYLPCISEELNVSLSAATVFYTYQSVASMLVGFFIGSIAKKFGSKFMALLGVSFVVIAYLLMWNANDLISIYIAGFLLGCGAIMGCMIVPFIIPAWFIKRQGSIVGICMSASGLGGIIGGPLASALIDAGGWHFSCIVFALICGIIAIPSVLLLQPDPYKVGQHPLGYEESMGNPNNAAAELQGPDTRHALLSLNFILVFIILIGLQFAAVGNVANVSSFILSRNMDLIFAGFVITIYSITNTINNILIGIVNDRWGFKAAWIYITFFILATYITGLFVNGKLTAVLFAIFLGACMPASGTGVTLLCSNAFGPKSLGSMAGIANAIMAGIGMFSSVLIASIYTATGSYNSAFILTSILGLISMILGIVAHNRGKRMLEKHTERGEFIHE